MISHLKVTGFRLLFILLSIFFLGHEVSSQVTHSTKADLGSRTAKNGFRNEDDIKAKFLDWQNDADAKGWLVTMGFK